jgi:CRISPR/Cas system-associated protein Csm6
LVKNFGGHSIAVFNPQEQTRRGQMQSLIHDNRVNFVCAADYSDGEELDTVVKSIIDKIAADVRLDELQG